VSLRQSSIAATTTRVFLALEAPGPAIENGKPHAIKESGAPPLPASTVPDPSSTELAVRLGLIAPPRTDDYRFQTYRVLGFDPKRLWCASTKVVALDYTLVQPYPEATNCGGPNQVSYIDWPRQNPLPFVSLDYFDSLLNYAEQDSGELTLLDSPTLEARIERIWWDGLQYHATVWIQGSYKGKHASTTVEFIYNPAAQTVCVGFPPFKNNYIVVQDIQVCYYLNRGVICVWATVIFRPQPSIRAHLQVCAAITSPKPELAAPCPCQGAQPMVGCEDARAWVRQNYQDYEWGDCNYPDPPSADAYAAGLITKLTSRHGSQGNYTSGHRTINHGSPAPNTFMPYAGWNE
jgi:hypothetical protein